MASNKLPVPGFLDSALLFELGFTGSRTDTSLFIYTAGSDLVYILVYVNDCIITGSSSSLVQQFLHQLSLDFPIKDLGTFHYFLGVEVLHTTMAIYLRQQKYILDLSRKTNMLHLKPISSPMASSTSLFAHTDFLFPDPTLYRSTMGSLQTVG